MPRSPMCTWTNDWQFQETDRKTVLERGISGSYEKITIFSDGSSIRHGSGPCGDMYYDENGEEC